MALLAGCATDRRSGEEVLPLPSAPAPIVLDYGNGWYHTADGVQSITQVAALYKREPALVAQLNRTTALARPASGTMLYIPPTNNRERVRQVLARVQRRPELIPREPYNPRQMASTGSVKVKWATPDLKQRRSDGHPLERPMLGWFRRSAKAPANPPAGANQPAQPAPTTLQVNLPPGKFQWPVRGKVVTRFVDGWSKPHGIEIAVADGTVVMAARPGRVLLAEKFLSYGNLIVIDHGDGFVSAYGYNQEIRVKPSQQVQAGQMIASVGRPSAGSSPRLWFQIRHNGLAIDPLTLMLN